MDLTRVLDSGCDFLNFICIIELILYNTRQYLKTDKNVFWPISLFVFPYSWCTPCKALTPKLDAIVGEKDGLLELAKVDVDQNPDLAMQYEVSIGSYCM